MSESRVSSRAPTRIDFVGGWTDVQPFCDDEAGLVMNAAVDIPARVFVESARGAPVPTDPFVRAAARRFDLQDARVELRTTAPLGSGLGGSGAVGVALVSALAAFTDRRLERHAVAELAHLIEIEDLQVIGGRQDQYAAAFGGFLAMTFQGDAVEVEPLTLAPARLSQLQAQSVLVYSGMSHLSGDVHARVRDAFQKRTRATLDALATIRRVARAFRAQLAGGSLEDLGALLEENWQAQKCLHPSTSNATVDHLFRIASENGALGGKALGAGGGGCLYFLARPGETARLTCALEAAGASALPIRFDLGGVVVKGRVSA